MADMKIVNECLLCMNNFTSLFRSGRLQPTKYSTPMVLGGVEFWHWPATISSATIASGMYCIFLVFISLVLYCPRIIFPWHSCPTFIISPLLLLLLYLLLCTVIFGKCLSQIGNHIEQLKHLPKHVWCDTPCTKFFIRTVKWVEYFGKGVYRAVKC